MSQPSQSNGVVIVGAGAAGLMTAIFARRSNPDQTVRLLEGARRPGAKILVSGGSRCNVTNAAVTEHDFWGGPPTIVRRILRAFPVDETVTFFRGIGIELRQEAGGKLFPTSNRSRDVLEALLAEAARVGVELLCDIRVNELTVDEAGHFRIDTSTGPLESPRVVLATGGRSLPKSGSDGRGIEMARRLGHTIVPTSPALAPLLLPPDEPLHAALSGVSVDVEITVWIDGKAAVRLDGPLLWTHFGVSGPVALNASRHWHRADIEGRAASLTVNFYPGAGFQEIDERWTALASERPKTTLQNALATMVPASLAAALIEHLTLNGAQELAHLTRDDRRRLVHALAKWPLPATGTRGYNYAEVTAGGVDLREINPATMESRVCRGLYLVGEILDVDGRIGGFNFQWAWSTGRAAGVAVGSQGFLSPEP